MYEDLTKFDKCLAKFGDKVSLLSGLEISNKISPDDAYLEIKKLYKELKKLYKKSKLKEQKRKK